MRLRVLILFTLGILLSNLGLLANEPEYKIKAGYLYYFGHYTKWPPKKQREFVIGVIGEKNPFGKHLDNIQRNKKIKDLPIKIIHVKRIQDIKNCQLLFVNEDMRPLMKKIEKICKELSILTLSDYKEFSNDGGCITFFSNEQDQIRFSINRDVVDKYKLVIDSQLLDMAEKEKK